MYFDYFIYPKQIEGPIEYPSQSHHEMCVFADHVFLVTYVL